MTAAQLNDLAVKTIRGARQTGDPAAFRAAVTLFRAAVDASPAGDPDRAVYLTDLCAGCTEAYPWIDDETLLAEGIQAGRSALAETSPGDPDEAHRLSSLGDCLRLAAEVTGDPDLLAEAIDVCRRAVDVVAPDDSDRGALLANLANALHLRYHGTGDRAALDESISVGRLAVEATADGNPDAGFCLSNLSVYLNSLFQEDDDVAALRESADVGLRAVAATSSDEDDAHVIALMMASDALQLLGERTGEVDVLIEGVRVAERATELVRDGQPDRAAVLSTLGMACHRLAARTGDAALRTRAVETTRQAVQATPPGHVEGPLYLANLAATLRSRYEHDGELADLEDAIETNRRAMSLAEAGGRSTGFGLTNLANDLESLYRRTGDADTLAEAVRTSRAAVVVSDLSRVARRRVAGNLAVILQVAYDATGDLDLLLEADALAQEIVAATADDDPQLADRLNTLMCGAQRLALRTGDAEALTRAVSAGRQAVAAEPENTVERAGHLANLSTTLQILFTRTDDRSVLAEAIDLGRQAVAAASGTGPADRSVLMSNLSLALSAAYDRLDDPGFLTESIDWSRQALAVAADVHFYVPGYLSNLGLLLRAEYNRTGDPEAIREAAEISAQAVDALPEGHPDRGLYLSNLGAALRALAGETGDRRQLAEAVRVGRLAVRESPADHPDAARFRFNLGSSLMEQFRRSGRRQAVIEARRHYRTASAMLTAPPSVRVACSRQWGVAAMAAGDPRDALRGFDKAVELLPQMTPRRLARSDREFGLRLLDRLPAEAAAAAVAVDRADRAVELLELARGMLLAESMDNRGDLSELREHAPDLAEELIAVRDRLDVLQDGPRPSIAGAAPGVGGLETSASAVSEQRLQLQKAWDDVVARIRRQPGFEGFLQPPPISRLREQAVPGPVIVVYASEWRSDALILSADAETPVIVVPLPELDEQRAYERVNVFLSALADAKSGGYAQRRHARSTILAELGWLWRTVVWPVLRELKLTTADSSRPARIWWCPVGVLAFLPLHAAEDLVDGEQWGVSDLAVSSYTATIRVLEYARRPRARMGPGRTRDLRRGPLIVAMPETPGAAPLDGVPAENARIQAIVGPAAVLEGRRATHKTVCRALQRHRVVHFACHGVSDAADPSASRLLLHDHRRRPFTVLTVSDLKLEHADLAYLSACSTSAVTAQLSDEAVHLASAFQVAGFQQVIGTLWPVDADSSAQIAADFYQEITEGGVCGTDGAARALQLAVRSEMDRFPSDPVRWAGYVHVGV